MVCICSGQCGRVANVILRATLTGRCPAHLRIAGRARHLPRVCVAHGMCHEGQPLNMFTL